MDNVINQFENLTGADSSTAKFYLDSTNNNLELAVSLYFDSQHKTPETVPTPSSSSSTDPPVHTKEVFQSERNQDTNSRENIFQQSTSNLGSQMSSQKDKEEKKKRGMFSLSDMNDDEPEDNENDNKYYTGGSSTSGQQVIGPNKSQPLPDEPDKLTEEIFKKAKEKGAQSAHEVEQPKFSGSGKRLGNQESTTDETSSSTQESNPKESEKTITITFYADGFTIDDGEFRSFADPKNKQFLEAINNGYIPREVAGNAKDVNVNLVKNPSKYVPPPVTFKAFKGSGNTLGAQSTTSSTAAVKSSGKKPYTCDESKPYTTIQIRLKNGSMLKSKFNLSDPVRVIFDFVLSTLPDRESIVLLNSFPRKPLTELDLSIQEAKLKNASLIEG